MRWDGDPAQIEAMIVPRPLRYTSIFLYALLSCVVLNNPRMCFAQETDDSAVSDSVIMMMDSLAADTVNLSSTQSAAQAEDTSVMLPRFYDFNRPGPVAMLAQEVSITGNDERIYYSLRDAISQLTSFYTLRYGPIGQTYGITYLGLPPYLLRICPDRIGSYLYYSFPPAGISDHRLVGIELGDRVIVNEDDPVSGAARISVEREPYDESGAYSEAQIMKGDFSYSNTDVIFKQKPANRLGWGFRMGLENSGGYISSTGKNRENFYVHLDYKLNHQWQMSSNLQFMKVDDTLSQRLRWNNVTTVAERSLSNLSLVVQNEDSLGSLKRLEVRRQEFAEKVRSRNFYLGQRHDLYGLLGDYRHHVGHNAVFASADLEFRRITFDPGYDYYTRFRGRAGIDAFQNRPLSLSISGNYLYDWSDEHCVGGSVRLRCTARDSVSAYLRADMVFIPPTDMARFLNSEGFDFNGDGEDEYVQSGDRDLSPTRLRSVSGGLVYMYGQSSLDGYAKAMELNDLIIWEADEGDRGGYYQAAAVDGLLYSATGSAQTTLFNLLTLNASYTYSRITESGSEKDLSLMPRHNLHGSISWQQKVPKLQIQAFPIIEAEYHSIMPGNYANPSGIDRYLLVHGRIALRVKKFTFHYSMENILNTEYETVSGYPLKRRVWWGIRWIFFD
jgi:hypothetical protein